MKARLDPYEVTALIAFVMHYIDMDMRHRLMTELPGVYNKMVGRKVVATVLTCTGCERPVAACHCPPAERAARYRPGSSPAGGSPSAGTRR